VAGVAALVEQFAAAADAAVEASYAVRLLRLGIGGADARLTGAASTEY
jgi:hypothetical protein